MDPNRIHYVRITKAAPGYPLGVWLWDVGEHTAAYEVEELAKIGVRAEAVSCGMSRNPFACEEAAAENAA
jgi:hypothetical protein